MCPYSKAETTYVEEFQWCIIYVVNQVATKDVILQNHGLEMNKYFHIWRLATDPS